MRSSVAEVLSASPSKLRRDISEQLAGHLVTAKADSGRFEVKTGCRGQLVVFQRITSSRISSNIASTETVRRRSKELEQVTCYISGGSDGVRVQEVAGLKRLSKSEQEELPQEAGLSPSKGKNKRFLVGNQSRPGVAMEQASQIKGMA